MVTTCRNRRCWARRRKPAARTLVIGLGNPIVTDDSVGLRVADLLAQRFAENPRIDVVKDYWGGLRLMEQMVGYTRVIVIDATQTGESPGAIRTLPCDEAKSQRSASAHDVDLATALTFGRRAGASLPANRDVTFVTIEAQDVINFSETCTPAVAAAIPLAATVVERLLREDARRPLR